MGCKSDCEEVGRHSTGFSNGIQDICHSIAVNDTSAFLLILHVELEREVWDVFPWLADGQISWGKNHNKDKTDGLTQQTHL